MAADPEATGWIAAILSALGINAAGWVRLNVKQGQHDVRIQALETERRDHARKIDDTHTTVTQLGTKMERVDEKLGDIKSMLEGWRDRGGSR